LRKRHLVAVLVAVVASLLSATAAGAQTTTVGAALPGTAVGGATTCSYPTGCGALTLFAIGPAVGAVAPYDGTVTQWRLQDAGSGDYSLAVLHDNADGSYTVTAISPPATPAGEGLETFPVDLPIKSGEHLELSFGTGVRFPLVAGQSALSIFETSSAIGATVAPGEEKGKTVLSLAAIPAYNADIEAPSIEPTTIKEVITKTVEVKVPTEAPKEAHCVVPKLTHKKLAAAKKALKAAGCKVGFLIRKHGVKAADAKVIRTLPKPGARLPAGTPVSLKLG
jgi:hypothetical protein